MPLIPPNFSNNSTPQNKPPWARGPASNSQQAGETGSRKHVKFGGQANSNIANPQTQTATAVPVPVTTPVSLFPEQPKTSKLQINLKSVKKPDGQQASQQPLNLPQQPSQPTPVVPEYSTASFKNPPGKGIPIPIVIQKTDQNHSNIKPVSAPGKPTTIPIQIQRPQVNNDAVIKTESKPTPNSTEAAKNMAQKCGATAPPAPPPPPGGMPPPPPPLEGLTTRQLKLEQLRKPNKKRPDWGGMMKEIEKGRHLNHIQCDDRSKPLLSRMKSRGRFVYESEAKPASKKDALHNIILQEIQQGVKLKKVHCDDRSKPVLLGLRVRRQGSLLDPDAPTDGVEATIAEQVEELAFLDIDLLRDELQSAKQLLETEVDTKHALERKTRDQKCQIIAMEAEIETLKAKLGLIPEDEVSMLAKGLDKSDSKTFKHLKKSGSNLWKSPSIVGVKKSKSGLTKDISLTQVSRNSESEEQQLVEVNELEEEMISLKEAVQHARKQAEETEAKYKEAMDKLSKVEDNLEESEKRRNSVEVKVETLEAQKEGRMPIPPRVQTAERTTQTEVEILDRMASASRQQSTAEDGESTDEEEPHYEIEIDEEALKKKKHDRELILWDNKLKSIKDKQHTSRMERRNLKTLQRKLEAELKDASKNHNKLKKEVDKMAIMLKDVEKELEGGDDDDEGEEEEKEKKPEPEEEETDEEEESEEESESDTEEEEDSSDEDDESASYEERLALFGKRVKRRENVLNALRKGNYLLRANIDRLKDDLEEARIAYHDLEHDLKAVLDET